VPAAKAFAAALRHSPDVVADASQRLKTLSRAVCGEPERQKLRTNIAQKI
jgi:hypothetical protein